MRPIPGGEEHQVRVQRIKTSHEGDPRFIVRRFPMCSRWLSVIGAAATILVFGLVPASGQTRPAQASAASTYTAPRMPDGQPNIQGAWVGSNPARLDATSLECGYEGNGTGHHENFTPPAPGEVQDTLDNKIAEFGFLQKDGVWQKACGPEATSSVYFGIVVPYQPWARAKKDEMFGKVFQIGAKIQSLQDLD